MDGTRFSTGSEWAIASPHWAASDAGAAAFQKGGNAVDAALAAAVALTVTYPHNCSVGGDLFALVRRPDGQVTTVNGSGPSPSALTAELVGTAGVSMPQLGALAVTVPGAVGGWHAISELGARLGFPHSFHAAVELAGDGLPLARSVAKAISDERDVLRRDPGCAGLLLQEGEPLPEGALFRQPTLARTLEQIAVEGPSAVYGGSIGRSWVGTLSDYGSPITTEDMATYRAELAQPVACAYKDLQILVAPPNSQGFVLLEMLAAVENLGLDPDPIGSDAPILAEVFRRTSADRDRYLADPRRMFVSVDELLSEDNAKRITDDVRRHTGPSGVTRSPSGDTIALVAADAEGWAVSLIQSLYFSFGSGILDPGTGVVLHNRGACFSLDAASPNVLEGGKRPLHTLMPVIALRRGVPVAICGSMGGGGQPQINAMSLLRLFGLGLETREVLPAPRWVVGGWGVDSAARVIEAESRVPAETIEALEHAGFEVTQLEEWSETVGHAHVIVSNDRGFEVASDPRADGTALTG